MRPQYTPRLPRTCLLCGAPFTATPHRVQIGEGLYCSRACGDESKRRNVPRVCQQCGKDFSTKPSQVAAGQAKYCSRLCANAGKRAATTARFWGRMDKSVGDCWLYVGPTRGIGYGQYHRGGRAIAAHRLAYELTYGPIPEGMLVRHTCDVPRCCNPAHLLLGTVADNVADKVARGRAQHGEGCYNARLTDEAVREIRARFVPYVTTKQMLADEYGVSTVTIDRVVRRVAWKHVA